METAPDFDALRAERNKKVAEAHQRLADELGVPLQTLRSNHNPNACYTLFGARTWARSRKTARRSRRLTPPMRQKGGRNGTTAAVQNIGFPAGARRS